MTTNIAKTTAKIRNSIPIRKKPTTTRTTSDATC